MSTFTQKNLGQSKPAAATPVDLYTVPALTSAVVSVFVICNQSASPDTVRISRSLAGAVTDPKDYLAYDMNIDGNAVIDFGPCRGMCLSTTDKVRVYSTNGTCSFNMDGQEKV